MEGGRVFKRYANMNISAVFREGCRVTHTQRERETGTGTEGGIDKQGNRKTERQTDRHIECHEGKGRGRGRWRWRVRVRVRVRGNNKTNKEKETGLGV